MLILVINYITVMGRGCHVLGEWIIWRQFVIKPFGRAEMDVDVLIQLASSSGGISLVLN